MAGKEKPLLLFSPLDWGLGHTTRSVSLLRHWLSRGARIIVACNSTQKAVLEREVSGLQFVHLEGYGVRYTARRTSTRLTLALQTPKILIGINREHRWLRRFLAKTAVDMVVSDNRYGFFSNQTPSILITHQLQVRSGLGTILDSLARRFIVGRVNRFAECWVPDLKDTGIAGELSHPPKMPFVPVVYIGLLSRFNKPADAPRSYRYCVLLSGPEPQRSIFEKLAVRIITHSGESAVLLRGLPLHADSINVAENIKVLNFASSQEIKQLTAASEYVICRAGYSSIMDVIQLKKKTILVPTPGQGEQEYLSEWLSGKYGMQCLQQKAFSYANVQLACEKLNEQVIE